MTGGGKEKNREAVFGNTLELFRNYIKQLELLFQLLEGVAWERMKQEPDYRERSFLTVAEELKLKNNVIERIPWSFIPNHQDFSAKTLREYNVRNYKTLKRRIKEIKEILIDVEILP